jgi:hypothetical protein
MLHGTSGAMSTRHGPGGLLVDAWLESTGGGGGQFQDFGHLPLDQSGKHRPYLHVILQRFLRFCKKSSVRSSRWQESLAVMPLPRILVGVMTGQSFCRSLENIENSRIPASQKVVFRHLPHGPAQSSPGPRVLTVGCGATSRGNNARPLPSVPRSCFQDGYFYPNHRILFLGSLWAAFPQAPPPPHVEFQ